VALKAWESSFCLHPREVLPTVYSYIFHYLSQASALYCLVEPISDRTCRAFTLTKGRRMRNTNPTRIAQGFGLRRTGTRSGTHARAADCSYAFGSCTSAARFRGGIAASEGKEMGPENGYEGELRPHEVDAPPAYPTAVKVR
jgi:hypothetical protein